MGVDVGVDVPGRGVAFDVVVPCFPDGWLDALVEDLVGEAPGLPRATGPFPPD